MSFSLQSRDLIADSIETVMSAQWYDANISLPGCDKNMPGSLIAMARLNRCGRWVFLAAVCVAVAVVWVAGGRRVEERQRRRGGGAVEQRG